MKKLFIYALAFAAPAAFAIGSDEVCLYDGSNFQGMRNCYSATKNNGEVPFLQNLAKAGSSIQVGKDVRVDLFANPSFQGEKWPVEGDEARLGKSNNQASSLRISKKVPSEVCIYEQANYGGARQCWNFTGAEFGVAWLGGFNDKTSSVSMPEGVQVTGFQHAYFGGTGWTHQASTASFPAVENDKWSSLKFSKIVAPVTLPQPERFSIAYVSAGKTTYWSADTLQNGAPIAARQATSAPQDAKGLWIRTPAGEIRSAANPSLCVGRMDTGFHASVNLYTCNGSDLQKWVIAKENGSMPGKTEIAPATSATGTGNFLCIGGFDATPANSLANCFLMRAQMQYFMVEQAK